MSDIGERLKNLRLSQKMTMEEMGEALGSSKMAVSRWERGERNPKDSALQAYANFFNVPIDWIRYGDYEIFLKNVIDEEGLKTYDIKFDEEKHFTKLGDSVIKYCFRNCNNALIEVLNQKIDSREKFKFFDFDCLEAVTNFILFGIDFPGISKILEGSGTPNFSTGYKKYIYQYGYNKEKIIDETIKLFKSDFKELKNNHKETPNINKIKNVLCKYKEEGKDIPASITDAIIKLLN